MIRAKFACVLFSGVLLALSADLVQAMPDRTAMIRCFTEAANRLKAKAFEMEVMQACQHQIDQWFAKCIGEGTFIETCKDGWFDPLQSITKAAHGDTESYRRDLDRAIQGR